MVSRNCYGGVKTQSSRYSTREHHYLPSHPQRELPSGPLMHQLDGSHHSATPNSQNSEQVVEREGSANARKRIPVACGRCRKRKIRCSGDPGNGQPCTNCKSAGSDQCQFLRVSSTEAPLRFETADLGHEALARLPSRGLLLGPQQYNQQGQAHFPYRSNTLSMYHQDSGKAYYAMPTYPEFIDENANVNVDYLSGPPVLQTYPLVASEHLEVVAGYGSMGNARNWTHASQSKQNQFLDQSSAYHRDHVSYASSHELFPVNLASRSKGTTVNNVNPYAASLGSNDRVLPLPGNNRQASSFLPGDSLHSASQSTNPSSYTSMNAAYLRGVNSSTMPDVASASEAYPSDLSNNSPESTSSQDSYNSQPLPAQHSLFATAIIDEFSGPRYSGLGEGMYSHRQKSERGMRGSEERVDAPQSQGRLTNGRHFTPHVGPLYAIPPMNSGMHPVSRRLSSMQIAAS